MAGEPGHSCNVTEYDSGKGPLTQAGLWHVPFQACHVEGGSAGLIPSQLLEEKRKAFVKRDLELTPTSGRSPLLHLRPLFKTWPGPACLLVSLWPGTLCGSLSGKKKKRMMYLTTKNAGGY